MAHEVFEAKGFTDEEREAILRALKAGFSPGDLANVLCVHARTGLKAITMLTEVMENAGKPARQEAKLIEK